MTMTESASLTGTYQLDPAHTRLGFVARHAMVTKVRGAFDSFDGQAHLDFDDPTSSTAEVRIDVASLNTHVAQRDDLLRGGDFFDAARHPQVEFRSTGIEVLGADQFLMTGDLSIKGHTRSITIEFVYAGTSKDPYGSTRAGFEGYATLSRKQWGLTWNVALETGGFLISDKITLELEVSAVKVEDE